MNHLITHARIVGAFVIREIATRYGRSPGGYLWALVEPVAFIAIMSVLTGVIGRIPAMGDSFPLYYASGYMAFQMFKGMEVYVTSAISANKGLMAYPKVAPIDAVAARFLLQAMTSVVVSIVVISGTFVTVNHAVPINWELILAAVTYAWILALGISLMNIVLFSRYPIYEKIFGIVSRPLFLLSGVFYVPSEMPSPFREVLLDNPLTHIVILFREGFYGPRATDGLDLWFLRETSLLVIFAGMTLFTFWSTARERS